MHGDFGMKFDSGKCLLFVLVFFAILVSFGSVCAADTNNAYDNYAFGHLDQPTVPNNDLGDLPIIGGDSVAVNDINVDDNSLSDNPGVILDDNGDFIMSARYNTGTGYYWVVSSDSYGVDLSSIDNVVDYPDYSGSSATSYYKFHVTGDDYYVKLILLSPTGEVVKEIDSNMING